MFRLFAVLALLQFNPEVVDVKSIAAMILDAVTNKNWALVAGIVVWLLVYLTRKYGAAIPFLAKFFALGWSGPLLAVVYSAAGAVVTSLLAGQVIDIKTILALLLSAASAVFTQEVGQKAKEAAAARAASVKSLEDADKVLKGGG